MPNPLDKTNSEASAPLDCEQWEALLADKMDGAMAPEAEAAFAEHAQHCPGCSDLLEQARLGQEWLKLLEEHAPAAPVTLLSRILAKTQGAGHEADFPLGASSAALLPGQYGRWGLPFLPASTAAMLSPQGAHKARLLMTAGMAFFSVALTLSVAGVRLTQVHAAELRPQAVQANVSRSFYGTKKQVVSFYENLRLVYEVESKMHDIRRDSDQAPAQTPAQPQTTPAPQPAPKGHAATSGSPARRDSDAKRPQQVEQVEHGTPISVSCPQAPAQAHLQKLDTPAPHTLVSPLLLPGATSKERIRI